jgi:hypothetical protein
MHRLERFMGGYTQALRDLLSSLVVRFELHIGLSCMLALAWRHALGDCDIACTLAGILEPELQFVHLESCTLTAAMPPPLLPCHLRMAH